MSVNVRYWCGAWVVDVSTKIAGKRQRSIKTFGQGAKAKTAAQAYAEEIAPQAKAGKFWERRTATFADLWDKFAAHERASPDLRPSTVADYKALGRLYLVPHLGPRLLSEPNAQGERHPIDADILLRNILRRALRKAGLPPLRFHDLRHMAGTLMHEAGVPLKRAQEILGHASERTTLAIYTHSMRRTHDDSADKIAVLAGLAPAENFGNKRETISSVEHEESELTACLDGSPGRARTADQRINSPSLYH